MKKYRLKPNVTFPDPVDGWIEHGVEYDGEPTPGWPRDPSEIRLYHPDGRSTFRDVSLAVLIEYAAARLGARVRIQEATDTARQISAEQGTDRMTLDEIDGEISASRRALRRSGEER